MSLGSSKRPPFRKTAKPFLRRSAPPEVLARSMWKPLRRVQALSFLPTAAGSVCAPAAEQHWCWLVTQRVAAAGEWRKSGVPAVVGAQHMMKAQLPSDPAERWRRAAIAVPDGPSPTLCVPPRQHDPISGERGARLRRYRHRGRSPATDDHSARHRSGRLYRNRVQQRHSWARV